MLVERPCTSTRAQQSAAKQGIFTGSKHPKATITEDIARAVKQAKGTMTPEARIAAISKIVELLPTLQVVLAKAADREGFTTKEDGTDPQKKYWARKYLDKFRDAIVATIFSTLAGGAVGIMAWSYFFGTKSVLEKAKIETKKEMHNQLVQSEEQRQLQAQEIQRLKDELERYKARGTQRKPLPPR